MVSNPAIGLYHRNLVTVNAGLPLPWQYDCNGIRQTAGAGTKQFRVERGAEFDTRLKAAMKSRDRGRNPNFKMA
nr:hypothetical protein [Marinicella sp. W31]MDC2877046.1 hypothetical protein [Marinicella sp. W31]